MKYVYDGTWYQRSIGDGAMMLIRYIPEEKKYKAYGSGFYHHYTTKNLKKMIRKGGWYRIIPGTLLRRRESWEA